MNEQKENLKLDFVLETDKVCEIASDAEDWEGDGIESIGSEMLAEMTKNDEKPFFVEIVALYEGLSGNNRQYTKEAVRSCVNAMVGVNMYKGHEEPGTSSWRYREPVGKIVAAKLSEVSVDGQRVLAAKGKAYITEADAKLRGDISRQMAGPLSILGNARAVRELGSAKRTITHIHKPLRSVDFCNPGTNGMSYAGVTAVVREMSNPDSKNDPEEPKEQDMGKLSKEALLAEYGSVITELVGEQLTDRIGELAKEKKEYAELKQKLEDSETDHKTQISEMEQKVTDLTTERDGLAEQLKKLNDNLLASQLKEFATSHVAEMKKSDDHDENVVEMAAQDLEPVVIDGDLEKSKEDFKNRLANAIKKTEKLAEMFGGNAREADDKTRQHRKNPTKNSKKVGIDRILSADLQSAGKGKE